MKNIILTFQECMTIHPFPFYSFLLLSACLLFADFSNAQDPDATSPAAYELLKKKEEVKKVSALDTLLGGKKTPLVLAGAKVKASSTYRNQDQYSGQKAIDGNMETRWATNEKEQNYSWEIDFQNPQEFNQILLFENKENGGRLQNITVSLSMDGKEWMEWRKKGHRVPISSMMGKKVRARYVKLEMTDPTGQGINIDEVQFYDNKQGKETPDPTSPRLVQPDWITPQSSELPNVYQKRKAGMKYGMFIHYGLNTFVDMEWSYAKFPASAYNPNLKTLDPDSWVKAAHEGGMNFIVLVAKHHEGFALWDTSVGDYNIKNTGRKEDCRDIVKEVSLACKKYGIKLGIYYSAWDSWWDKTHTKETTGLDDEGLKQAYNDYALTQIKELMDGRYGEIVEFWIDGAWVKSAESWEFARIYDTVKRLQPSCQMAVNWTVTDKPGSNKELLPNEHKEGDPMRYYQSDFRLADPHFTKKGANADPKVFSHEGKKYYLPFEATICINNSWFWSTRNNEQSAKSPEYMEDAYNHMVEQGNTLVMNLAPNKDGVFSDYDIKALYAGARKLGIARGSARSDVPADERCVEVRHETTEGRIVGSTEYLYGKKGARYTATPISNAKEIGYKLIKKPGNISGMFGEKKIAVVFIYEDVAKNSAKAKG